MNTLKAIKHYLKANAQNVELIDQYIEDNISIDEENLRKQPLSGILVDYGYYVEQMEG